MKFLHSMIRVKNIEKSTVFYKDLIGLKPSRTVRLDDCVLYYFLDEKTGTEIELTYNDETPENGYVLGSAFGHFAFEVEDMGIIAKKVEEMGYEWLYAPFYMEEVNKTIAFIKDPDGNEIEFITKN